MPRFAVIGAGLSGLVTAGRLQQANDVVVFEKSGGVGGRMATRYENSYEFDHGAQFFTARSGAFKACVQGLVERGVVAIWRPRFAELDRGNVVSTRDWGDDYPHYAGVPRMNAIGKALAAGLDVRLRTAVARLERRQQGWRLHDDRGADLGAFDWVVLAMPAGQTAALAPDGTAAQRQAGAARMRACFALMLGFETPLALPWDAALVRGADISWISANSSKPQRPAPFTLVVHSTNAFADANFDADLDQITAHLLSETSQAVGDDCTGAATIRLQRWRYANIEKQDGSAYSLDKAERLAACGDWFIRGRVEAAFISGHDLSDALLSTL